MISTHVTNCFEGFSAVLVNFCEDHVPQYEEWLSTHPEIKLLADKSEGVKFVVLDKNLIGAPYEEMAPNTEAMVGVVTINRKKARIQPQAAPSERLEFHSSHMGEIATKSQEFLAKLRRDETTLVEVGIQAWFPQECLVSDDIKRDTVKMAIFYSAKQPRPKLLSSFYTHVEYNANCSGSVFIELGFEKVDYGNSLTTLELSTANEMCKKLLDSINISHRFRTVCAAWNPPKQFDIMISTHVNNCFEGFSAVLVNFCEDHVPQYEEWLSAHPEIKLLADKSEGVKFMVLEKTLIGAPNMEMAPNTEAMVGVVTINRKKARIQPQAAPFKRLEFHASHMGEIATKSQEFLVKLWRHKTTLVEVGIQAWFPQECLVSDDVKKEAVEMAIFFSAKPQPKLLSSFYTNVEYNANCSSSVFIELGFEKVDYNDSLTTLELSTGNEMCKKLLDPINIFHRFRAWMPPRNVPLKVLDRPIKGQNVALVNYMPEHYPIYNSWKCLDPEPEGLQHPIPGNHGYKLVVLDMKLVKGYISGVQARPEAVVGIVNVYAKNVMDSGIVEIHPCFPLKLRDLSLKREAISLLVEHVFDSCKGAHTINALVLNKVDSHFNLFKKMGFNEVIDRDSLILSMSIKSFKSLKRKADDIPAVDKSAKKLKGILEP